METLVNHTSRQAPKEHHFTPVFYLKAWARNGRVTRYSRPLDRVIPKLCAPKLTGSKEHLYTHFGVPLDKQAYLETEFFSPIDSKGALAHAILLEHGVEGLKPAQRVDWARFMMSMQIRSPFGLSEVERLADQTMRSAMQRPDTEYDAIRKPGEPETIYDWTAVYQRAVIENAHKTFLPGLIDHEQLGTHLINMNWAIFDAKTAPITLLTSDRPFISTKGWKDRDAVLLFPLNPTKLFFATNGKEKTECLLRKAPNQVVKTMNDSVTRYAIDFVFGTDPTQLAFVERRLRRPDQEPMPGPIGKGRPNCPT